MNELKYQALGKHDAYNDAINDFNDFHKIKKFTKSKI